MPRIVTKQKPHNPLDDFPVVDDMKLRMSLSSLSDKWDEFARNMIYNTYNDPELMSIYRGIRASGMHQHGGTSKVRREVVRFPNGYVFEFCKAVFEPMYGKEWPINKKVWQHELIKPWLLIEVK